MHSGHAMPPFHLAFPVRDIPSTRAFYEGVLGARVGRSAERWIDFDFWGHQLSAHIAEDSVVSTNVVDGEDVPVRHFGVVLPWADWHALVARLTRGGASFLIEPGIRFVGEIGEQATFFIRDPSGNALEFKSFKDPERMFAA